MAQNQIKPRISSVRRKTGAIARTALDRMLLSGV